MKLTDEDKRAIAQLLAYARGYACPLHDVPHVRRYCLAAQRKEGDCVRLYLLGIVKKADDSGAPAYQMLVLGENPLPDQKLPDIPPGCEPWNCALAVLRREIAVAERSFVFELLELKERDGDALVFGCTGVRVHHVAGM